MQITSVDLEINPDDPTKLDVFTTDTQQEAAKEDAEVACWVCGHNPTVHNLDDECPGKKELLPEPPVSQEGQS